MLSASFCFGWGSDVNSGREGATVDYNNVSTSSSWWYTCLDPQGFPTPRKAACSGQMRAATTSVQEGSTRQN